MALTAVDKINVIKYLKETVQEDICFLGLCDSLNKKRGKVQPIEFLTYFTNYFVDELKKAETLSIKHQYKVVYCIEQLLIKVNKQKTEISEDLLTKIRNLDNFYEEFCKRTAQEIDEEFQNSALRVLVNGVNELYPEEEQKEDNFQYVNKILDLEKENKDLSKSLADITQKYDELLSSNGKDQRKIKTLIATQSKLQTAIETKDEEIKRLTEQTAKYEEENTNYKLTIKSLNEQNESLFSCKENYDKLMKELEHFKEEAKERERQQQNKINLQNRYESLETLIYQKLLIDNASLEDLIKFVHDNGFVSNKEELSLLLGKIRTKILIEKNNFDQSPIYRIASPFVTEENAFNINIPGKCKSIDVILVSDFHIKKFDNKVLEGLDLLYDYCAVNDVHLILNLGDFFQGTFKKTLNIDDAKKNYKIVEQAILSMPKVGGITHAILGGNHDKNILRYGFDPIKMMADEREDIVNLGYTHSVISLNSPSGSKENFDIHHPGTFDFSIEGDDEKFNTAELNNYLHRLYKTHSRSRNDSYIDLFGHTHRSQFNYPDSYVLLPPFFDSNVKRGACHLKITFDSNAKIKYMLFMPLSIENKLVKNNEIIYKKILTK